ncbi:MAG: ComF family protein [Gemmatimonadetes bacterium]|nr:ComF family protein [Gemmatimonadota bacterium]
MPGPAWALAVSDVARLLLPNACVACGRLVESDPDALLCGVCRVRLRPMRPGCPRCAQPLPPVGPCRFCARWVPELTRVRSAVWLTPEAREVAHHLKYDDYPALATLVGAIIARDVAKPESGCLIPIPLGAQRLRSRGYNQAGKIARALAGHWGLPVSETALRRARETPSQTSLTPEARLANVTGAFAAFPPPSERRNGSGATEMPAAILVDDVLTTGATLSEAAQALAGAGWGPVMAVTFARAEPFEIRAQHYEPVSTR